MTKLERMAREFGDRIYLESGWQKLEHGFIAGAEWAHHEFRCILGGCSPVNPELYPENARLIEMIATKAMALFVKGDEEELPAMDPMIEEMVEKSVIDSTKKWQEAKDDRDIWTVWNWILVDTEHQKWESAGEYLL